MKIAFQKFSRQLCATMIAVALSSTLADEAFATNGTNLASMVGSTGTNLASFPKLISAACYVGGAALIGTGVMKVKGHVDNPGQTPLREGLIRLVAGGVLVAAPAMTSVMTETSGVGSGTVEFTSFGLTEF